MRLLVPVPTLLLAFVFASPVFSQIPTHKGHNMASHDVALLVDGAKTPDLIDNTKAYRHFGLRFARHRDLSAEEMRHKLWLMLTMGLPVDDYGAIDESFAGVRETLDGMGDDQALKNAVLDSAIRSAEAKMSFAGITALQNYVDTMVKPTMKQYGNAKGAKPNSTCTCVYDVVSSYDIYNGNTVDVLNVEVQFTDDSGCNHSSYSATVSTVDPSGNPVSQTTTGESSTIAVNFPFTAQNTGFTGQSGTLNINANLNFYCPCILNFITVGTPSTNAYWAILTTYLTQMTETQSIIPDLFECVYRATYCLPSILFGKPTGSKNPPTCSNGGFAPLASCPAYGMAGYVKVSYSPSGNPYICFPAVLLQAVPGYPGGSAADGPGICG